MSEKLSPRHESGESLDLNEQAKSNLERALSEAEKSPDTTDATIEKLRQQVEHKAISGKELTPGENETTRQSHSFGAHQELKTDAYKRGLRRIQSQLQGPEKQFSKVVHRPVIEKVSNIGAQTIARPSGILAGGLVALLGSSFLLYTARRYGFSYNFSLFILLFVAGYFAGLLIELLIRTLRRKS